MKHFSLGVLGSTRGTVLEELLMALPHQQMTAQINVVVSNKKNAFILERARQHHIPALYFAPEGVARDIYDRTLAKLLRQHAVDLVVLIGYMRILSAEFVRAFAGKIINVHPSLLPDFAGGMDEAVHEAVLAAGMKETGCTVHLVTEQVDAGPVLIQKKCAVLPDDTVETLKARVQTLEGKALIEAILLMSS